MTFSTEDIYNWDLLSKSFCNKPVRVVSDWPHNGEPVAAILLCGMLAGHDSDHDPTPPMSEVQ